jgi:hypothetical protein
MFHRLQKKSPAQKSTIFALAIFITSILVVPLWILSFKKSLTKSKQTQGAIAKDTSIETFDTLKENFGTALDQFQDAIQQLEQTAESESNTGSTKAVLPSVPVTGDQLILPRSE